MEVLEKTDRKVVVRRRRHGLVRAVAGCLLLALLFYLLDARHPKSSLYCARHAVLPDNEFEAAKGIHVEDIDCSLIVRPTRTALDLTFFGEISYSFEIVSAHLVRPPKQPPHARGKRSKCSADKRCTNSHEERDHSQREVSDVPPEVVVVEVGAAAGDRAGGKDERQAVTHHSMHMGANDVATLVLEDNQGFTYDFYTFQDEAVAERMLETVDAFIREARKEEKGEGSPATEGAPLELEVLYDDSWLDEMACGLFFVLALVLMTRPYTEVVEFDAESGAMALDRWNLFQCGVFRYSCALENISKLEITEANVYTMSAHAFEDLRQTKEFGLRLLFSLPPAPQRAPSPPPPRSHAASGGRNFDAIPQGASEGVLHTAVVLGHAARWRWSCSPVRIRYSRWQRHRDRRQPLTRSAGAFGEYLYLDLLLGRKARDDRKLRRPVELVNDLLLRFANIGGNSLLFKVKLSAMMVLVVIDLALNSSVEHDAIGKAEAQETDSWGTILVLILGVQLAVQIGIFASLFLMMFETYPFRVGLMGLLTSKYLLVYAMNIVYIWMTACVYGYRVAHMVRHVEAEVWDIWDLGGYLPMSIVHKLAASMYYVANLRAALMLGDPMFYSKQAWVGLYFGLGGEVGSARHAGILVSDDARMDTEGPRRKEEHYSVIEGKEVPRAYGSGSCHSPWTVR